ncbi:MAG: hypothetical protein A3H64_00980 [Candidatus Ryanbacteria bacterium RIFCSPLOWO2_02_FULL_45_11c]|uniref:DUF5678 domain-containing protein n=1 Tax=Candidatus Ryanbacteria bacterium RIFCSPLOWO2_02_FULL_45_11c TaxID=1802128 RepID=A0A1G2H1X2_9BACT|nr:MAG: hypothetical protein A3H64_00980 [Candidatus Ryanbacteria bacterium RIFCSPLOWO2_02_FULL_45_11c]
METKIPTIDIKKYGGKEIAILNGTVVAVGKSLPDVIQKLKKIKPNQALREVLFLTVPKSLTVIYHV